MKKYSLFFKRAPAGKGKTRPCQPRLVGSYWDVQDFALQLRAMHNSIKNHASNNSLSDWYDIYFDGRKLDADDPVWLEI